MTKGNSVTEPFEFYCPGVLLTGRVIEAPPGAAYVMLETPYGAARVEGAAQERLHGVCNAEFARTLHVGDHVAVMRMWDEQTLHYPQYRAHVWIDAAPPDPMHIYVADGMWEREFDWTLLLPRDEQERHDALRALGYANVAAPFVGYRQDAGLPLVQYLVTVTIGARENVIGVEGLPSLLELLSRFGEWVNR